MQKNRKKRKLDTQPGSVQRNLRIDGNLQTKFLVTIRSRHATLREPNKNRRKNQNSVLPSFPSHCRIENRHQATMRRNLLTTDGARGRRSQKFFETRREREREREQQQQQQPHWHNMYLPEVFVKATTCIQGIPSRNFAPLPSLEDLQTPKPISSLQKRLQKNHTRIGKGT